MNPGRWIAVISGVILIFGGFFISLEPATRIVALLAGTGSFLVGAFDPDNLMNIKFGKKGVEINRYQPTEKERDLTLKLAQDNPSPEIENEGEEYIEEAKERSPEKRSPEDYLALATEKWRAKNYDAALANIYSGLALNPENVRIKATLTYRKGVIFCDLGLKDEAIKHYNEAMILDSKFSWPRNGLGNVYYAQEKLKEAEAEYKKAIKLDSDDTGPHYNLGILFSEQGKLDDAKREYEEALRLDPDFTMAKKNLEKLKRKMGKEN